MSAMSPQVKSILGQIEGQLLARNVVMASCDIVQPAEAFLDMAGEDLRRRIFLTQSARGETMCLRPEFTIPVCAAHIEAHNDTPQRYGYYGQVFRQRRADGSGTTEFYQAGIEDLGHPDIAAADAQMIDDAIMLSRQLNSTFELDIIVGDQALFVAVLQALGLPDGWQERLIHAFGQSDVLELMLTQLSSAHRPIEADDRLASLLERDDHEALTGHLAAQMEDMGYGTHMSRTPEDIARRMLEKQHLAKVALSEKELTVLRGFLALECPLGTAMEALNAFADTSDLNLASALKQFSARLDAMAALDINLSALTYRAAFGRPLDYYTGLVFEIKNKDNDDVLAAGGRYDRLMALLGAEKAIAAVGFSVWLERFVDATPADDNCKGVTS